MKPYQLHIKNMVCDRCVYFVEQSLKQLKVQKAEVRLGRASFLSSRENIETLFELKLNEVGLSILKAREEILLESIKHRVAEYLDGLERYSRTRTFSTFLKRGIGKNYHYLSKFFKDTERVTLEFYVLSQKVERVKRLIRENELSLKEIAEKLQYSSLQHLSAQFSQITGMTVTQFKNRLTTKRTTPGSISGVLSDLKSRGFSHHFEVKGNYIVCDKPSCKMSLKDVTVKEVYRFEDKPGSYGNSAVFEVESQEGLKGFMICQ